MSIHQHKDGRYYVAYREPGNPSVKKKYFGRGASNWPWPGNWSG